MPEIVTEQIDQLDAFKRGHHDFDFFSRLALPLILDYPFPIWYLYIWQMLVAARTKQERARVLRFALGLPRGFAKTTFIKILICWFICYDYANFALVVCADEPLAYNLLNDIDEILGSPNMEKVYGKWTINKAINNKEQKTCLYRNKPRVLVAVGFNSNVRGLNIKNERPDILFFDDAQTPEGAASDTESKAFYTRFAGTFLKLIDPQGALIIYVGNMYAGTCMLASLRDSKSWISLITGCILADGSSLWPELHPVDALFDSFKNDVSLGQGHVWFAEMMNDPIEQKTSLLPDGLLPACPYTETDIEERAIGGCVIIDPAGYRVLSDENIVGVHLVMDDSNTVFADGMGGVVDPEKVIIQALEYCIHYNLSIIGVETTAYQQTLKFWLEKYIADQNLPHIQVVELSPAGRKKLFRIIAWIKEILAGTCHVYGAIRNKILWQALAYKVDKKDNKDDWLDDGAYILDVRAEYWDQILMTMKEINPKKGRIGVRTNNTAF